jgi:hypothetical protein
MVKRLKAKGFECVVEAYDVAGVCAAAEEDGVKAGPRFYVYALMHPSYTLLHPSYIPHTSLVRPSYTHHSPLIPL